MPSVSYLKNKHHVLNYNAKNPDRVREWARVNKRRYDIFHRECRRLAAIMMPDVLDTTRYVVVV